MPLWPETEYYSAALYFPPAPQHLHTMLAGCGFEERRNASYDWNGLCRGEKPMCIFQCTLDGEGELMTGGRTWRLKTGDTMLLSVPEDHRYRLPQDSPCWKHVYVNLSGSESVRIWTELKRKFGPVVHLPIDRSKSLDSAFSIVSAAKNKRIRSALHASSLAYGFLMTLFEELTVLDITASEASFVLDAVRFCMEHYAEDITVADIADAAGYSRCHFSRMFTRIHGTSGAASGAFRPYSANGKLQCERGRSPLRFPGYQLFLPRFPSALRCDTGSVSKKSLIFRVLFAKNKNDCIVSFSIYIQHVERQVQNETEQQIRPLCRGA